MAKKINAPSSVRSLVREGRGKQKSKIKFNGLIKVGVILVIISCILGLTYLGYRFFKEKPMSSIAKDRQTHILVSRAGVTSTLVVLESNENFKIQGAWYIVNNPRNASVFVYYIPPGVYVKDYLNKVSEYVSAGDLKYIGDSIAQDKAIEYSVWQLGNLTGVTPDSYIWVSIESLYSFSKLFGDVSDFKKDDFESRYSNDDILSNQSYTINSFFEKLDFSKMVLNNKEYSKFATNIDTNLSQLPFLMRLKELKGALASTHIYMLDLSQIGATSSVQTASGRTVNLVNYDEVDQRLSKVVKELKGRDIEREQVKIEIYNASEIEGLASRYSRKFQNAGIDVVRYENAPSPSDKTIIYAPKSEQFANSLKLVKNLVVVPTEVIKSRPDFMTTGDIVVILGKDMKIEALWQ